LVFTEPDFSAMIFEMDFPHINYSTNQLIFTEHILGFNYGFNQGSSLFFINGDDGLDEIRPKLEEYLNDPRWHYGETKMLGSTMGRKYAVLSWEEIQSTVDIIVEKVAVEEVETF